MKNLESTQNRIFSLKLAKRVIITLVIIFVFDFFLFPIPALASEFNESVNISEEMNNIDNIENGSVLAEPVIINSLPENDIWQTKKSGYYTITAYSSEVAQCDGSPCITANGFNLCEHGIEDTIATNFLPFGAKVRIPEITGDKVFIVRDRMNPRYHNRLDIWMLNKQDAKKFGVKVTMVEILE